MNAAGLANVSIKRLLRNVNTERFLATIRMNADQETCHCHVFTEKYVTRKRNAISQKRERETLCWGYMVAKISAVSLS